MQPNALDIIALILGIFFSVRKLDVSRRRPEEFPHVDTSAFSAWRARESRLYTLLSLACFLRVLLNLSFVHFGIPRLTDEWGTVRAIGAAIDISWLLALVVLLVKRRGARRERERLGIRLGGFQSPKPPSDAA